MLELERHAISVGHLLGALTVRDGTLVPVWLATALGGVVDGIALWWESEQDPVMLYTLLRAAEMLLSIDRPGRGGADAMRAWQATYHLRLMLDPAYAKHDRGALEGHLRRYLVAIPL